MPDQNQGASSSGGAKTRRKRPWLKLLAALFLVIIALVLLAPTLVSLGLGQGFIRGAINDSINGSASFADLKVGWFGGQSIKGLTIKDQAGAEVAKLDATIDGGLLSLLLSRSKPIQVALAGHVNGVIRPDGSLNFADLSPEKKPNHVKKPKPPRPPGQPVEAPALPPVTIKLDGLAASLDDQRTNDKLSLTLSKGVIQYVGPQQPATIDLEGQAQSASAGSGTFTVKGQAANLIDAKNRLTLRGGSLKLDAAMSRVPLRITLPGSEAPATISDLAIKIASDDLTGTIVADISAASQAAGGSPGSIKAQASVSKILLGTGELSLRGGGANISLIATNAPIAAGDVKGTLDSFTATIMSDDLTKRINVAVKGDARLEGRDPSSLAANVSVDDLLTPEGGVTFAVEKVTGTVSGQRVPTALLQPMLASTPIEASRDLGDLLDVRATFSAGQQREVSVSVAAPKATLELAASVNQADHSVVGSNLLLKVPAIHPELADKLAHVGLDRPGDLELHLTSFKIPAQDKTTGKFALADAAATGAIRLNGPLGVTLPIKAPAASTQPADATTGRIAPIEVASLAIDFDSPRLGDGLKTSGSLMVDGGKITIDERITNLFDQKGGLSPAGVMPVGSVAIDRLPRRTFAAFVPEDQREIVDETIGDSLSASVSTTAQGDALRAEATVTGQRLNVSLNGERRPEGLAVGGGTISLGLTPKLVAALQKGAANPITLQDAASCTIELQPFELANKPTVAGSDGASSKDLGPEFEIPLPPIRAIVAMPKAVLGGVPELAEPVSLSNLNMELQVYGSAAYRTYTANGDVQVARAKAERGVCGMRLQARVETKDGKLTPRADIGLADVSVGELERLMGKPAGAWSQWLGPDGTMRLFVEHVGGDINADIKANFPNVVGEFSVEVTDAAVSLAGGTTELRLPRAALQQRMNPPAEPGAKREDASAAETIEVLDDMPATLTVQKISFPRAMIQKQPFDPAAVLIDASLDGGALRLKSSSGATASLRDVSVQLNTKNLKDGVAFSMKGRAESNDPSAKPSTAPATAPAATAPSDLPPGTLDIQGAIVDLVSAESTLDTDAAKMRMTARASGIPTAIADAVTGMQGLLVAAVGPMMDVNAVADDFSKRSGDLDARIRTTNGWLNLPVRGNKDDSLRSEKNKPIQAELSITKPLRERLLEKINPILADIRTTEQPLRVSIPYAVLPTDGDVSKLKADVEITVGKVELDSGSTTLKVLAFFQQKGRETIPGSIEPISAKIRNGIVKYDKFSVRIDKYTLNYSGQIDLVKKEVDLRTEIPLKALGDAFKELEGYADNITVPLVTRGAFGKVKTTIDPKFDLGKAALDAGFKGTLENILNGKGKDGNGGGGGAGGILDDLLNRGDKDREKKDEKKKDDKKKDK